MLGSPVRAIRDAILVHGSISDVSPSSGLLIVSVAPAARFPVVPVCVATTGTLAVPVLPIVTPAVLA